MSISNRDKTWYTASIVDVVDRSTDVPTVEQEFVVMVHGDDAGVVVTAIHARFNTEDELRDYLNDYLGDEEVKFRFD